MAVELLTNINLRAIPTLDPHLVNVQNVNVRIANHNADALAHQSAFTRHNADLNAHPGLELRGLPEIIPLVLFDQDADGNFYRRTDGLGEYVCVATPDGGVNMVQIVTFEGRFQGVAGAGGNGSSGAVENLREEVERLTRELEGVSYAAYRARNWIEDWGDPQIEVLRNAIGQPVPVTFAFGGVPAVNSMINVPLTMNLSITSANLSASRYYNAINPSSTSTFQLRVMPANTVIATCTVNTAGTGSFSGAGSTTLGPGNTLRMTATAVGQDLTDASITIHATRR